MFSKVKELDKDVKEAEEEEDADKIDYILTYDLDRFQQDVTRARQGGVITDVIAAKYLKKTLQFHSQIETSEKTTDEEAEKSGNKEDPVQYT